MVIGIVGCRVTSVISAGWTILTLARKGPTKQGLQVAHFNVWIEVAIFMLLKHDKMTSCSYGTANKTAFK